MALGFSLVAGLQTFATRVRAWARVYQPKDAQGKDLLPTADEATRILAQPGTGTLTLAQIQSVAPRIYPYVAAMAQQQAVEQPDDPFVERVLDVLEESPGASTAGSTVALASQCPAGTKAVGIGFNPNAGPFRCSPNYTTPPAGAPEVTGLIPTVAQAAKPYFDPTMLMLAGVGVLAVVMLRKR